MAKTNNLTDFLIDLADSIREIEGSSDAINPQDFHDRIINSQPTIYNGETELLVPTVSGVWVFNETVNFDITTRVEVSAKLFDYDITFIQVDEITKGITVDFSTLYEVDIKGQSIDFGTEPQEVSEEFYTWFTSNAVKQ